MNDELELVERLKNNEMPFGLLPENCQSILRKAGNDNIRQYSITGCWSPHNLVVGFELNGIYRLKEDYQLPIEYEFCEIDYNNAECVSYLRYNQRYSLANVLNIPGFIGYYYDNGWVLNTPFKYKSSSLIALQDNLPLDDFAAGKVTIVRSQCVVFSKEVNNVKL